MACSQVFLSLYLKGEGLTGTQLGTVIAIGSMVAMFTQPLWGQIADGAKDKRLPLALMTFLAGFAYLFYLIPITFFLAILTAVALSCVFRPIISLLDSQTSEFLGDEHQKTNYGGIRMWGTIGFLGGNLIAGWTSQYVYSKSFVILFALFSWVTAWSCRLLPRRGQILPERSLQNVIKAVSPYNIRVFLIIGTINFVGGSMSFPYMSIYFSEMGMSKTMISLAWIPTVISEVVGFWVMDRIMTRLGPRRAISLGRLVSALRWFLFSKIKNPIYVFPVALLHGISLALNKTGVVTLFGRDAPKSLRATAITFRWAWGGGVCGSLGVFLGGVVYDRWGFPTLFRISSWALFIAGVLHWFFQREPEHLNSKIKAGAKRK